MTKTMEMVNKDTQWNVIKETAKELGINSVGIKKDILIASINDAIAAQSKKEEAPKGKWYEEEGVPQFNPGDVLEVCNREFLAGRKLQMVEYSKREGFIRGYMIDPKSGKLQKTLGSHKIDQVQKSSANLNPVTPKELEMVK